MKDYFEKNLITNEFITVMAVLLISAIMVIVKGSIPEGYGEIVMTILVFVGRGALNANQMNKIVDKQKD